MLRIPLISIATIVISATFGQTDVKSTVINKTKTCTSNSSEIIESQDPAFVKAMMHDGLKRDFVSHFGTTVHECLHGYDNELSKDIDWDENTYPIAYFVDKDIVIKFAGKRLFKTEELHPTFFSKDVQNLFRYGTYVQSAKGPSEASSNQWGFYGLLEEFNAYYHDVRAQIEFFICEKYDGPSDETFGNSMHAYFEFNIFMANYLKFAKLKHPKDYEYLINNQELRTAYTLIEYSWRNLLTEIMSDQNLAARMPSFDEEFRLFNEDLKNIMSEFMIPESDLLKFDKFLKSKPSDMKVVEQNKDWAEQYNMTGFGAGMSAEELTKAYEGFDDFEMEFEEKESGMFYVVILTTKSEEALMEGIVNNYPKFKKMGIVMDSYLNFSIFLNKFNSKEKAQKYLNEIKSVFPEAKIL